MCVLTGTQEVEGTWHAAGRRPRTVTGLLGAAGRRGGALLSVLCGALISAYAVSVVKDQHVGCLGGSVG